jgi:uncharacterized membrane-anchored protein
MSRRNSAGLRSTLEERAEEGDWDGALKLLDAQKATRQFDKESLHRRRAVLLTAKAMATFDTDQAAARSAALEANRLAPSFCSGRDDRGTGAVPRRGCAEGVETA